jgi:hypothetical protein
MAKNLGLHLYSVDARKTQAGMTAWPLYVPNYPDILISVRQFETLANPEAFCPVLFLFRALKKHPCVLFLALFT